MIHTIKKSVFLLASIGMLFAFSACNLDPEIYGEYDRENFENSESAFDAKLGDVYVNLQREYGYAYREGFWSLQENTTDECVVPTRFAGDWYDGGVFWELHNHRWTSKTREISKDGQSANNAWAFAYRGVSKCNSMMKWMRSVGLDQKRPADMAELYILRAWYHYLMIDNFGNVQFVSQLGENGYQAKQGLRHEICDSVMNDLLTYVPQASEMKVYSRVNKYVGWMVLAKMYMNAEAWGVVGKSKLMPQTAEECYAKASAYCDSIITLGGYTLATNYFDNFKVDNQSSPENIWCVFYDASFSKGMQFHMMTLHYQSKDSYGLKNDPWNGYCTTHRVLGIYGEGDTRINCWERGQQYSKAGAPLTAKAAVDTTVYLQMPKYTRLPKNWPATVEEFIERAGRDTTFNKDGTWVDKKGKEQIKVKSLDFEFPAVFTDTITTLTNSAGNKIYNIFEGARFVKFQVEEGVADHMSNDFPIYRLADVYLMKAEAEMRANGGVANEAAVAAANLVRTRSGASAYNAGTLTLDELCNERCRELMWEGHRRQDLIRFGRFTGVNSVQNDYDPYNLWILKYTNDKATDNLSGQKPHITPEYMKVFPLPDYVVANGFIQNEGYKE